MLASPDGEIRWDARLIPEEPNNAAWVLAVFHVCSGYALKRLDGSMDRRFVDGRKFPRMLSSLEHIH